jgi:hypothetical protein
VVEVHDVPIPFGARREIGEGRVVVDAVLCGDLVCDVDVLRVEEFFKPTTGSGLVLLPYPLGGKA